MKPNINPTHMYSPYNYMKFMILLVMVFISLLSTILSHNIFNLPFHFQDFTLFVGIYEWILYSKPVDKNYNKQPLRNFVL